MDKDSRKQTFLDLGANIGFYSILALNKKGFKKAIAFEVNPDTYKTLKKNIKLNQLEEKVMVICGGLGDKNETLKFEKRRYHTGGSRFVDSEKKEALKNNLGFSYIDIPTQALDKYVDDNNIDVGKISFIKIDVEGFELKVLKGMKNTLEKLKTDTCLFVEIWIKNSEKKETLNFLKNKGFVKIDSRENDILFIKR